MGDGTAYPRGCAALLDHPIEEAELDQGHPQGHEGQVMRQNMTVVF